MPFGYAPGMTLGGLIYELRRADSDDQVEFDFCQFVPDGFRSYRGCYEDLAIGWQVWAELTVKDFLAACSNAVGKTMQGYKGGEYKITQDTPLWVANMGEVSRTIVKAVDRSEDGTLVLVTERWRG